MIADVPAVATVKPGDSFRVESKEWFDGTIVNSDDANDVRDVDLIESPASERVGNAIEIADHVGGGIGVAIDADRARVFVLPATDVEDHDSAMTSSSTPRAKSA